MSTASVARPQPAHLRARPRPVLYYVMRGVNLVVIVLLGLVVVSPFILAFLGSFKTDAEIIAWPPTILPKQWLWQNWVKLWNTDFGGLPQPLGTTSLGFVSGLLAFLLLFLTTSLRSHAQSRLSLPRGVGLGAILGLTLVANAGVFLYLLRNFQKVELAITVAVAFEILSLLVATLVIMSRPAWDRAVLSTLFSLAAGVGTAFLVSEAARLAGGGRFVRWLMNITVLSLVFAFLEVIFCAMAGYAFARLRFPGNELIFGFVLASMMIPGTLTLVPAYVLITKLGWANTAYSLILPGITSALGIFMLRQFLKTIPRELEEAALIDGASHFQIFKDIVLPLARPALLTLFILQFQAMWNNFITPLLYMNTPDMWVLNVALSTFQQQYKAQWNITLVGAMINAFPILLMFFFFSKYFIEGVGRSGLKE